MSQELRDPFTALVREFQQTFISRIEAVDGKARFHRDEWVREGGGGGLTAALADGAVFERAGVNTSVVHGELSQKLAERLGGDARDFHAAGLSVILHPRSPMVPTVHMNIRRIEKGGDAWFGGGADLTPYYLWEEDARHFHSIVKQACDRHAVADYQRYKEACDKYFWLPHREEARGIGGLFFDDLRDSPEETFRFVEEIGRRFLDAYLPIVERRKDVAFTEEQRHWQSVRRGRYVEFNLVYDRGTLFGLETQGRTESILVSMPPLVRWEYAAEPEPGSREAELIDVLRQPRSWVG